MARIKNIRVISEIRGQKVSPSNQRAHVAEREQDQPPVARASVACNERVFIKESEAVRRPAVGCIAWLDCFCYFVPPNTAKMLYL